MAKMVELVAFELDDLVAKLLNYLSSPVMERMLALFDRTLELNSQHSWMPLLLDLLDLYWYSQGERPMGVKKLIRK